MFVRRAQQIAPDFTVTPANLAAITGICHRRDGLPLALELAAARTRMFGPQTLYERLERRLPLSASQDRDSVARHRTLRDALAWSYDLLSPAERGVHGKPGALSGARRRLRHGAGRNGIGITLLDGARYAEARP